MKDPDAYFDNKSIGSRMQSNKNFDSVVHIFPLYKLAFVISQPLDGHLMPPLANSLVLNLYF
jgi:hypothetical protein